MPGFNRSLSLWTLRSMKMSQRWLLGMVDYIGETTLLACQAISRILLGRVDIAETIEQMAIIGVHSLPIVLITVTFAGMVLALYTARTMATIGLGNLVGALVATTMAREVGPVLSAVVVAARAGSAIAAQIGSMKVTEQIDALRALAVSPVEYLVVPRLISTTLMLPIITILADIMGTLGGYIVAAPAGITSLSYLNSIEHFVDPYDINSGLAKTLVFGFLIALISCHQGLSTQGGAAGVGKATTNAVVLSIISIYVADFILVRFFFPGRPITR